MFCDCSKLCQSSWPMVAKRVSKEEYGSRMKSSWELVASMSGFISGFTYIVSNGVPEYHYETIAVVQVNRQAVFTILVMIAFIFSLLSTLLGFLLVATLDMIGLENAQILRERHEGLCNAPQNYMVLSIFVMLVSTIISIGGVSGPWVFSVCFLFGVFFVFYITRTYYWTIGHPEILRIFALADEAKAGKADHQAGADVSVIDTLQAQLSE